MAQVIISPAVVTQLQVYAQKLSEFTGYQSTGQRLLEQSYKSLRLLETQPEMGRRHPKRKQYRELIVGQYLFLYAYDTNRDIVQVVNIRACKQKDYIASR